MKNIAKKAIIGVLLLSVLVFSGCMETLKETEAMTDGFFQLIADGYDELAYDLTAPEFQAITTYVDFVDLILADYLYTYIDFDANSVEEWTDGTYEYRTISGDFIDDTGTWPMEVYWIEGVYHDWEVYGFRFVE